MLIALGVAALVGTRRPGPHPTDEPATPGPSAPARVAEGSERARLLAPPSHSREAHRTVERSRRDLAALRAASAAAADPAGGVEASRLRVRLRDERQLPVEGEATLELRHEDAEGGGVRILALERGAEPLALAPGTLTVAAWTRDAIAGPATLGLRAGEEHELTLALRPATPVRGRIVDAASGRPLAGARVRFWTFAERDVAITDAAGVFEHPRFPAGGDLHQVRVEAAGHGARVHYLSVDLDGRWSLYDELFATARASGRDGRPWLELALEPAAALFGTVLDAAGAPLAGARVRAEGYARALDGVATPDTDEAVTADDGRFRLGDLRAELGHVLVVSAPGHAALRLELGPGSQDVGALQLARGRVVAGAVFDAAGDPVVGANVRLLRREVEAPRRASSLDAGLRHVRAELASATDEFGVFTFEHAADGRAELQVLDGERVCLREPVAPGDARMVVLQLGTFQESGSAPGAHAVAASERP